MAQQKYKNPSDVANSILSNRFIDLNQEGNEEDQLLDELEEFSLNKWNLNPREKRAIDEYTSDSKPINDYLRGKTRHNERNDKIISDLDNAIKRFELKNNLKVYRASDDSLIKDKNVGDVVQDNAFLSTTPFKNSLADYRAKWGGNYKPYTYIINIPKGAGRGAYLPYYSHFGFTENEFLLNRNNKYKISNIDKDKIYLDLLEEK